MALNKKKNNPKLGVEKSDTAKKYNIRISTPNGYFPEDVDKIIIDLEQQCQRLEKENHKLTSQYESNQKDLNKLKGEYQQLQFEMMKININTSDLQSYNQMESLMKINPSVGNLPEVETDYKKYEEEPLIDIIEDTGKTSFDEMVTPVTETSKNGVSIFKDDGSLDII